MIEEPGKGKEDLVSSFDAVVEQDDGASLRIPDGVIETRFRFDSPVVVVREDTPENKQIVGSQQKILRRGEFPVWGPEKIRFKKRLTTGNIFHIGSGWTFPPMKMVIGVVPNSMPIGREAIKNSGIGSYIGAHTEKSCPGIPFFEHVEDGGGDIRNRAIVECKEDLLFCCFNVADKVVPANEPTKEWGSDRSVSHGRYTFFM